MRLAAFNANEEVRNSFGKNKYVFFFINIPQIFNTFLLLLIV